MLLNNYAIIMLTFFHASMVIYMSDDYNSTLYFRKPTLRLMSYCQKRDLLLK